MSEQLLRGAASDWALVQRFQRGEKAAFNELVARHGEQVYKLAFNLTGDPEEAQDAAQEAFVRVYRSLGRFKGSSAFSTWLHRVVVNACIDATKRRRRRPVTASSLRDEDTGSFTDSVSSGSNQNPVSELERSQRDALVRQAVNSLPQHQRLVVVLCDIQGLSYEEAASALRTRAGTVKSRLHRARLALRDALEPHRELLLD